MTKFTPRPWKASDLIAAAPDLYEALETARLTIATGGLVTRDTEVYKIMVSAIAKAEGGK